MTIAAATAGDIHLAGELRARMAREHGLQWDDDSPGWRERFVSYFRAQTERGNARLLFAREDRSVVGMAIFSFVEDYRAFALGQRRGYVNGVYVLPEYRRRGIGHALMEAGIAWLRAGGATAVRLRSSVEGQPLYASLGFRNTSEMELSLQAEAQS